MLLNSDIIAQRVIDYVPVKLDHSGNLSSVMILLMMCNNEYYIPLVKRPIAMNDYSADYCFPGGNFDSHDVDLRSTAIRELEEEMNIKFDEYEIIGQLDDFKTGKGKLVRPFVSLMNVGDMHMYTIQKHQSYEVDKVLIVSIINLMDTFIDNSLLHKHLSNRKPTYEYHLTDGSIIWGLTASILTHLNNVILCGQKIIGRECSSGIIL